MYNSANNYYSKLTSKALLQNNNRRPVGAKLCTEMARAGAGSREFDLRPARPGVEGMGGCNLWPIAGRRCAGRRLPANVRRRLATNRRVCGDKTSAVERRSAGVTTRRFVLDIPTRAGIWVGKGIPGGRLFMYAGCSRGETSKFIIAYKLLHQMS